MAAFDLLAEWLTQSAGPKYPTPAALAQFLDPRTINTPALQLIDTELMRAFNTPDARLIISMPPQEGKTQRASRTFPLWAILQNPDTRVAIASYSDTAARRVSRRVRDDLTTHPDLGLVVRNDIAAMSEWQVSGHDGGMYAVGMGGSLTGRPVDLLLIDDPVKDRAEADSLAYRERAWDFWTEVGSTRLAPGAPVVVIQTRWHEDDLTGRLLAAPDGHLWRVVNIPAQADHNPAKGETDPLGRRPGEYLTSARGRTQAQWEAIKVRSGSRTWNALYQGRPAPAEGGTFKRPWWQSYDQPIWILNPDGTRTIPNADQVLTSWDMAFKDTTQSDFVVGQVWARRGANAWLVDQTRDRLDFTSSAAAVKILAARWPQAHLHLIEDKANGPAIINQLRKTIPGIVPVNPEGSKEARASAVTPYVEAGNVHLPAPALAPWVGDFLEETAGFPNGAHDDQVDAMTQALSRMYLGGSAASSFFGQLAPPCPRCSTPIPRSAEGICPKCGADPELSGLDLLLKEA